MRNQGIRLFLPVIVALLIATMPVLAFASESISSSPLSSVSVQESTILDEREDNDSQSSAKDVPINVSVKGTMKNDGDNDWFIVNVPYDGTLQIVLVENGSTHTASGWEASVYNSSFQKMTVSQVSSSSSSSVYSTGRLQAGTFYVKVTEKLGENSHITVGAAYLMTPKMQNVSLAGAQVKICDVTFNGKAQEPPCIVVMDNLVLEKDVDYTISYSDNVYVGTATAKITGTGMYTGTIDAHFTINPSDATPEPERQTRIPMYRLYNPYTGEHFYTASIAERSDLKRVGWRTEGIGWYAPANGTPVHRLYNPYSGDHHFTISDKETKALIKVGWISEGVGWYSAGNNGVPVYRQYNPWSPDYYHNYTTSVKERNHLIKVGWISEGVGWFGVK